MNFILSGAKVLKGPLVSSVREMDGWAALMKQILENLPLVLSLGTVGFVVCAGALGLVFMIFKRFKRFRASETSGEATNLHGQGEVENWDQITGLLSQAGLLDMLDRWNTLFALGDKQHVAVLVVDLDRFKRLNERYRS